MAQITTEKTTGIRDRKVIHSILWLFLLTIAGGLAFWATTIALSLLPIAAEYRAALSLSYFQTVFVDSLLAGLIIGCCISFTLLRFFEKIPTKNAILKSEILSIVVLVLASIPVQVAASRVGPSEALHVFLIGAALNVPRFLVLGFVVGYLYRRLPGSATVVRADVATDHHLATPG
jgi:hypothetical protein